IILGLDYMPDRNKENTIYNVDGSNLDAIVENNLFDGWNGENELISIKSSRNILRHNCVVAAPAASFNIRSGNNNLITGNWFANVGRANISGHKNTIVFNYYGNGGGHSPWLLTNGISAHEGQRPGYEHLYVYPPAIDNIVEFNVVNRYRYILQSPFELGGFAYTSSHPKGNTLRNNVFYSPEFSGTGITGGYKHVAQGMSEDRFRSVNRFGPNEIRNTQLPNASCGNAYLFEGPGDRNASIQGHAGMLGGERVIRAPSWWIQ
ncbi:MAG: chondroitinase-B domain-containing protein, partial [Granulosicoccus sp.]